MYTDKEFYESMTRWDSALRALGAGPRRQIVLELLKSPEEKQLPLPEGATVPGLSSASDDLTIALQHQHLPLLAEFDYVNWEREPFTVERGSRFDDVAAILGILWHSREELPSTLSNDSVFRNVMA